MVLVAFLTGLINVLVTFYFYVFVEVSFDVIVEKMSLL